MAITGLAWWPGMVAWHGGLAWWPGIEAWHDGLASHGMTSCHAMVLWGPGKSYLLTATMASMSHMSSKDHMALLALLPQSE